MSLANLFADLPAAATCEQTDRLLSREGLTIERIVSTGQASPAGFWYEQPGAEWVLVLAGSAGVRFEDETHTRTLTPGDFLDIAPRRRHRVEWTDSAHPTLWLAVHYR